MLIRVRRRRRSAFTLMEILLVLAILVVLASMVGLSYTTVQKRMNISATKTQIGMLEKAVQTYMIDVGSMPNSLMDLIQQPSDLPNPAKWGGSYLDKQTLPQDAWNNDFIYQPIDQDKMTFKIYSYGPNRQD